MSDPQDDGLIVHTHNESPEEVAEFWKSKPLDAAKSPMPKVAPTDSEILPMTDAQKATAERLTEQGWDCTITPPEQKFDGAFMAEDPEGVTHFVRPDGSVD